MIARRRLSTLLAVMSVPGAALAQTQAAPPSTEAASTPRLSAYLGVSHWSGEFGASTDSDISAAWVSARYRSGGLRLTASVPWMRIDSQGVIFTGVDAAPLIVAPELVMGSSRRDGFGDLTLGVAYLLPEGRTAGLAVDLIGKVKLPTGSRTRGVSTGKTDYALGVEVSHAQGAFTPIASVRYRGFGDAGQWRLHNGWATSVGGAYSLPSKVVIVASYDFAEAASRFAKDSHELVAGVSAPLGSGVRATGFISSGLSNGAADVAGGVSIGTAF